MASVSILGSGSWGTALAIVLADNGHKVTLWSRNSEQVKLLTETRENKDKLPGVHINDTIEISDDLLHAISDRDMIVLAVPSSQTRGLARRISPHIRYGQLIVTVSKGIEESTLKTLTEQIEEEIPNCITAVLSGPSHAEEVSRRIPTAVVAGARQKNTAAYVQSVFNNINFRVYTSPDVLGIEVAGALKNVIALAAGMLDGIGCGDNSKASLITRGVKEITELGIAMGGQNETFQGLTGIGDLIVTCSSVHSRNRKAGFLMGQGLSMSEAMKEVRMVVEGVFSAKAAKALADKYQLNLPIISSVNKVLFENLSVNDALEQLMSRESKDESSNLVWN
ncbi:MAG: NAD(P)-dependent glycerol-3-phosphate dehydrogenase [Clostridiales bacterium]|nr:NAD(P)-dependent glycerol-3-phosphate dehydrogenase [Clostridiales bacterium]